MKKEKGMADFSIDDLDYGKDDYEKNVNAYLTRNENKKPYYNPRRGRSKQKEVPEVPPISNTVAEMLIDLQKRIDAQNIQTLQPMQPMQDDFQRQLKSGIGTVIINALNKRSR